MKNRFYMPLSAFALLDDEEQRRFDRTAPVLGDAAALLRLKAAHRPLPENPHSCGYWNEAAGCFQRCPPPEAAPV